MQMVYVYCLAGVLAIMLVFCMTMCVKNCSNNKSKSSNLEKLLPMDCQTDPEIPSVVIKKDASVGVGSETISSW